MNAKAVVEPKAAAPVARSFTPARSLAVQHHLADALLVQARAAARQLRWAEAAAYSAASLAVDDRPAGRLGLTVAEKNAPRPLSRRCRWARSAGSPPPPSTDRRYWCPPWAA